MNNAGKPVLGEKRAKRHTLRSPEESPSQRDQIPVLPKCPGLRRSFKRAKLPKSCTHTNRLVRSDNQPVQPANQPVGHQIRPTGATSCPTGSREHQPVRVAATFSRKKELRPTGSTYKTNRSVKHSNRLVVFTNRFIRACR